MINLLTFTACYHEVIFEVVNWNPIPGVVIRPQQGILKPRSFFPLEVSIQIPVIMKLSFEVLVCIHQNQKISVKITGNIVVPLVRSKTERGSTFKMVLWFE